MRRFERGMNRYRVLIILPYVNSYRVNLLGKLHEQLEAEDVSLRIAAASPSGRDVARKDATRFGDIELKQIRVRLLGRAILLREFPAGWLASDLVIVEHAVKNLESFVILTLRRLLGKRTAIWGHGHTITEPTTRLSRTLQRYMARMSTWYFAYTEGSRDRAVKMGSPASRITTLTNSVDTEPLQKSYAEHMSIEKGPFTLLYVGGLDSSKRIARLLRVAKKIHLLDPRFKLIVGGKGEDEKLVEAAAADGYIDYRGSMDFDAKARAGRESQAMIITGRVGLAVTDAFAMNLPIITTQWEYHAPEFEYLDSSNSLIVPDDEDVLVASTFSLLQDDSELRRLSSGAASSLHRFSFAGMVDNFEKGIRDALA